MKSAPKDGFRHALLIDFLNDKQAQGLSPNTIRFYKVYLTRFLSSLYKPVLELTKSDISTFMNSLACSPGGKHAYFRSIRVFYKWAQSESLIVDIPRMESPKVPKPLRVAVKLEDVKTLLDAAQNCRDKLIVSLLADTGLRRSEACSVKWKDIDQENDTIRVWGKGAKQRVVRYGPITRSILDQWRNESKPEVDGPLFGLKSTGLQHVLRSLEKRTGIRCNAHAFRRTFASESIRNGLNIFYVQSLLGHSSLAMTRIYAEQVGSEDAIKAYTPIVSWVPD